MKSNLKFFDKFPLGLFISIICFVSVGLGVLGYIIYKALSTGIIDIPIDTDNCIADVGEALFSDEYDLIAEENKSDYVIEYYGEAGDDYKSGLKDRIVRLGEYQLNRLVVSPKDFRSVFIFIDVYFDRDEFENRYRGGVTDENVYAGAYATAWGNMVLYVDPSVPLDENIYFYRYFSHELVHLIQYSYYKEYNSGKTDVMDVPRWYLEGMATNNEFCLSVATNYNYSGDFDNLDQVEALFTSGENPSSAYAESFSFYGELVSSFGEDKMIGLLEVPANDFYSNAESQFGKPVRTVYEEWKRTK